MILITDISKGEERLLRGLSDDVKDTILIYKEKIPLDTSEYILKSLNISYKTVELKNFDENVVNIAKILGSTKDDVVISLSKDDLGILSILYAISLVKPNAKIYVDREYIGEISEFNPLHVSGDDLKIMKHIAMGIENITKLSKILNLSISTTWRRVKELEEKKLVVYEEKRLKLTSKGRIALRLY